MLSAVQPTARPPSRIGFGKLPSAINLYMVLFDSPVVLMTVGSRWISTVIDVPPKTGFVCQEEKYEEVRSGIPALINS